MKKFSPRGNDIGSRRCEDNHVGKNRSCIPCSYPLLVCKYV